MNPTADLPRTQAQHPDRLDVYTPIHKALRAFMTHTLLRLGSLDAQDDEDLRGALAQLSALLDMMRGHLQHENSFVHPLIEALLDEGVPFEEFQSRWAPSIVVGLGRLAGRTVGVIANNPLRLGGCLNSESAEKSARFVRLCDAFGIPLVVVVDVPGYLPGVDQEWGGVVRRGAKLLHAFGECVVPRVTLVTRKTYGGAYIAMNARSLGATKVMAWPGAEVAVMGAVAAIRILHRRRLAEVPPDLKDQVEQELAAEHERISGGVDAAVELGVVDEMVEPSVTRSAIAGAIAEALRHGPVRGRHGNIPL